MINFKNLGKALKYNNSSTVFWFRTEKYSYLFTSYWGIRTTKSLHLEKGIFVNLINLFQQIPEISKGCVIRNACEGTKPIIEQQIKTFTELIENIPSDEIKLTELIRKLDFREAAILKAPKNYIFVDRKFMDFIDITPDTKLYGTGPNNPIYAQNGEELAMLLPVRCDNIPECLKSVKEDKHDTI
jgi:hypothetical protein